MMEISFTLNGEAVAVGVAPSERLLDTLRTRLGLTGTKEGCGEGECGACTVMFDGLPANACLIPTFQAEGRVVETVESVSPHELDALHASGGTQCGACSPGVVMTALWVRRHPEILATHALRQLVAGNLCRCTGYDGIIDGIEAWLEEGSHERGAPAGPDSASPPGSSWEPREAAS
jgi:carbon-monoxide dehydrogenase small subunit